MASSLLLLLDRTTSSDASASITIGTLTLTAAGPVVVDGTVAVTVGDLRFGTSASPTGGAGGEALYVPRPISLPFEFSLRWLDLAELMGGLPDEVVAYLEERDRQLEDFLARLMPDLVFVVPGVLTSGYTTPRYRVRTDYRIDTWIASLDTAGSTESTLWILASGVRTVKIAIPASTTEVEVSTYALLEKDTDYLQVEVETAGSGAADLTVQGIIRH